MRRRIAESRIGAALLATWGVVIGVAPHVLHHVGPLAGAALLAGTGGKLLFGALGLLLSIPFLLRLHRRFHTLAAPAIATAAFIGVFAVSTLLISPLITGGDGGGNGPSKSPSNHWAHHHQK